MRRIVCSRFLWTLALLLIVPLVFCACQRQEETAPAIQTATKTHQKTLQETASPLTETSAGAVSQYEEQAVLFKKSIKAFLVEEQANVLGVWRANADQKPILLLFSQKIIRPLPEVVHDKVDQILSKAPADVLVEHVARPVADPLLLADLGVSAALRQGWFSKVVWVVPVEKGAVLLPLEDFKNGLRDRASSWGEEIDSFKEVEKGKYSGMLSGVPVEVVTIDSLPKIKAPLLVHIDTGFFSSIYRNEIKTPVYDLILGQFKKVSECSYLPLAVSVSRDTMSYEVPLSLRFLGGDIAAIVERPGRMMQPTQAMRLRGEMMYLDNFYQPEMIQEKARELIGLGERDAHAHYSLYRAQRQGHQPEQGLASLERAIALDPVYADEYIELINNAVAAQQPEAALALVDSAVRALPDNPLVKFRKAQLLVAMERGKGALTILSELKQLPWSEHYYPRIKADIDELLLKAQKAAD